MEPKLFVKTVSKAVAESEAPVIPLDHTPLEIITTPVNVHTTIVSINVWVIDTSACATELGVFAAAAAIGELPSPDSFENIPLATPILKVWAIVEPKKPPVADIGLNAYVKIILNAWGMRS